MKNVKILMAIMVSSVLLFSCANNKENTDQKENLKKEVKDVGQAANNIIENEKQEFKMHADSLLDEVNSKLAMAESDLKDAKASVKGETQEKISQLKAQRDSLNAKLETINSKTKNEWEEFKREAEHDMNKLKESINALTKDDVN